MTTVAESFPSDLVPQPCWRCKRTVVYATRTPTSKHGARPIAIELVPAGVAGNVAIQTGLIACAGVAPCAYEMANVVTRYRWHGPHCDAFPFTAHVQCVQAAMDAALGVGPMYPGSPS